MSKRAFVPLVAICLVVAASATAQMAFLDPGRSGFTPHVGIMSGDAMLGYGAGLDATIMGRLDLGATINRLNLDTYFSNSDVQVTAVIPRFALGLVRDPLTNAGVELVGSYEMAYYTSDWLLMRHQDNFLGTLTGMLSAHTCSRASSSLSVYPELGVGYMKRHLTFSVWNHDSTGTESSGFVFSVGASLLFNRQLRVSPAILLVDGEALWTTAIGYVVAAR